MPRIPALKSAPRSPHLPSPPQRLLRNRCYASLDLFRPHDCHHLIAIEVGASASAWLNSKPAPQQLRISTVSFAVPTRSARIVLSAGPLVLAPISG
jgi:hypothetical protein